MHGRLLGNLRGRGLRRKCSGGCVSSSEVSDATRPCGHPPKRPLGNPVRETSFPLTPVRAGTAEALLPCPPRERPETDALDNKYASGDYFFQVMPNGGGK